MIYSMTGFGRSQAAVDGVDLTVEINSVNRRNLELSVSLPREWQSLERLIQELLRKKFSRGKLHVQIQALPAADEGGFHWDNAGLRSSLIRLAEFAREQGISWPPDGNALVKLAALNKVEMVLPDAETISSAVLEIVEEASVRLMSMREMEGAALGDDLGQRSGELATLLELIEKLSAGTVDQYREILLQRLRQAGLELDLSDERLLKEVAIFADRCDIAEEITRLQSHLVQFSECLEAGSPIGRKLEFLLQEINREFNTIGSKANNIEVSRHVIEAKNEIERIREQLQNTE